MESFLAGLQIHKQMIPNDRVAASYTTSNAVRGGHGSMRPLNFGKRVTQNHANLNDQFNLKLEVKTWGIWPSKRFPVWNDKGPLRQQHPYQFPRVNKYIQLAKNKNLEKERIEIFWPMNIYCSVVLKSPIEWEIGTLVCWGGRGGGGVQKNLDTKLSVWPTANKKLNSHNKMNIQPENLIHTTVSEVRDECQLIDC